MNKKTLDITSVNKNVETVNKNVETVNKNVETVNKNVETVKEASLLLEQKNLTLETIINNDIHYDYVRHNAIYHSLDTNKIAFKIDAAIAQVWATYCTKYNAYMITDKEEEWSSTPEPWEY